MQTAGEGEGAPARAGEPTLRYKNLARIKRECGRIDGAVFSGMEFGADDAAKRIDEATFARIAAVKTRGVRAFHRAVRGVISSA